MPDFNSRIDEKLKKYPEKIQSIARHAIIMARKLDAVKLADLLENKVKSVARKEVKK